MKKLLLGFMILAAGLTGVASPSYAKMLQIKGSDTLINLVQRLAEEYMAENPGKVIAVTGGGSGTGIAALINNKCDIADASRLMKSKEVEQAVSLGIDPKRVVVAIDGLSVIVNKNNPVEKLTVDQIGKIYKGEIKKWSEVGGADQPIVLYGRQPNSGTYDFMMEVVLKGDYASSMDQMNGNAQIVEAVKQDASGIGYVGVGYAKEATGITVLKVAAKTGGKYADPLDSTQVKSGVYPVSRPLNQYVDGLPMGDVKDFIVFELSAQGQAIVEQEGFFPLNDEYVQFNKENVGL